MKKYSALALVFLFGTAFAGNEDCDHPRFQEVGCSYSGEQGPPGADGRDGADGQDGADGRDGADGQDGADGIDGQDGTNGLDGQDGIDGLNGKDGRDGIDGVVSETWITETRHTFDRYAHYSAAYSAIQIYLPQDKGSRITALGYAYKWDDREDSLAFTFGVGTSGGEEAYKASLGFEFGGDRRRLSPADRLLKRRLDDLERRFETEKRGWNSEVQACAAEMDEAREVYGRVEDKFMECLQK
jgi:hypothetical protein